MSTQLMSRRLQAKYMHVLISESERINSRTIPVKSPALTRLVSDSRFKHHLRILEGLGLISVYWIHGERDALDITITTMGMAFRELRAVEASDQRWTRGLAIAAILVSIASAGIAGLALYLQFLK